MAIEKLQVIIDAAFNGKREAQAAKNSITDVGEAAKKSGLELEVAGQKASLFGKKQAQLARDVIAGKQSLDSAEQSLEEYRKELGLTEKAAKETGDEIEKMPSKTSKMSSGFTSLAKGIGVATIAIGAAATATKVAYDTFKQGAGLHKTAAEFDILTNSINSTSDAMLGKLRAATKGYVSDTELMAGASQFISLGMAKTEEDVIRLSTVISGLGIDFQTAVLTFANNSELRLDGLGLSIEGVREKVAELESQGFEGDAFDEAVLQQLEEKYGLLESAMDGAAGEAADLDAEFKNLKDSALKLFTTLATPVVTGINDIIDDQQNIQKLREYFEDGLITAEKYNAAVNELGKEGAGVRAQLLSDVEDQKLAMEAAAKAAEDARDAFVKMTLDTNDYLSKQEKAQNQVNATMKRGEEYARANRNAMARSAKTNAEHAQATDEAAAKQEKFNKTMTDAFKDIIAAPDDFLTQMEKVEQQTIVVGGRTEEQNHQLSLATRAYNQATDAIYKHNAGIKDLSDKQLEKYISQQAAASAEMQRLNAITGETKTITTETAASSESLSDQLWQVVAATDGNAQAMALAAVASGQFTEAQAEAFLKSAALQAKITEIGEAIANDEMGWEEGLRQIQDFQAGLEVVVGEHEVKVITDAPTSPIDRFLEKLNAIPSRKTVEIVTVGGQYGNGGYQQPGEDTPFDHRAIGGFVNSGQSYIVGERGPEIFTPYTPGSITPNSQIGQGGGGKIEHHYHTAAAAQVGYMLQQKDSRTKQLGNLRGGYGAG